METAGTTVQGNVSDNHSLANGPPQGFALVPLEWRGRPTRSDPTLVMTTEGWL